MRRRGIAFVLTLGLLVPRVCLADEPNATQIEAARRLYQQALEDEKRGEYRQAIDKLQRASTVKTTAASRYHLGLCEEKLGHLVAALAYYQAAEQQAQAEGKKEVSELVREPLSRLSERVPRLTVRVRRPEPPGLEVLLDGKPLAPGLYDVEVRIDVGAHPVEARAPGHGSFLVTHDAREGSNASIEIRLEKQATPGAAAAATPLAGETKPAQTSAADRSASEPSPQADAPRGPSGAALVAFGGAALLGGFGVFSFLRAGSLRDEGQSACALRTDSCTDLRGPVRTWDTLALGSWVGAGGAVIAGLVLYTPAKPKTPVVSVGPSQITLGGTF